jgi:hypothetical protein
MSISFPQPGRQTIKQSAAESIHLRVGGNLELRSRLRAYGKSLGGPRIWQIKGPGKMG